MNDIISFGIKILEGGGDGVRADFQIITHMFVYIFYFILLWDYWYFSKYSINISLVVHDIAYHAVSCHSCILLYRILSYHILFIYHLFF